MTSEIATIAPLGLAAFSLTGKTAVITGGARGIGYAIAEQFIAAGARVMIADLNEEIGQAAAKELSFADWQVPFFQVDLTNADAVSSLQSSLSAIGARIDIGVNCAGICENTDVLDISVNEWRQIIDVNLTAMFLATQMFGRLMSKQGGGSIVCIGSNSGLTVDKPQPQAHYNASKAGVHQMVRSFAAELAPSNIRVNAVAPGYTLTAMTKLGLSRKEWVDTWTEMTPMRRFAEPIEIANGVHFLASDAASYVTGTVLLIDGGYSCW
jgi:NAD(P)-dependent dehydrogenase (short-subunit alcohol dehydrogenase family)